MTPIIIVADDLTGALDSAVPFALRGLQVRVALGVDAIPDAVAAGPDVLAIDTRSRALPAELAAERIGAAWSAAKALVPHIVMKKVDSRLKGEVAAETAALLAASGRSVAIACPAIPEQGRIVRGGMLTGHGIATPIAVAELFREQPCEIPDAQDSADLDTIARGIIAAPDHILAIGARGLAEALAGRIAGAPLPTELPAPAPALPMILAIGSRDPITDAQIERLYCDCPELDDARHDCGILMLRAPRDIRANGDGVAKRLAREAVALARTNGARSILCSGGDTASAVMDALDACQLVPEYELAPGIPVARIEGANGLRLISKSGGFGAPDALARIARHALARQQVAA